MNSLSPELLAAGATGDLQAFEAALPPGKQLFDMTGVVTTGLFYKLSRGCPVFVKLADGTSYVIVGYTEDDIIYWDEAAGTTAAISRSKADAIYRRGGYTFYSWENAVSSEEDTAEASAGDTAEVSAGDSAEAPAGDSADAAAEGSASSQNAVPGETGSGENDYSETEQAQPETSEEAQPSAAAPLAAEPIQAEAVE